MAPNLSPDSIERVSVYPPLGLARVGNAPGEDAWFFASEVRGATPTSAEAMPWRDSQGRILRQAVRFRVYAHLDTGDVVEVVDGDGVEIEWRVTVANLKAGWYEFSEAMDLPPQFVSSVDRRNAMVTTGREQLDITPATCSITGRDLSGPDFVMDDGSFFGTPVYLGELRTDEAGRLIFLGGRGQSAPRAPGTRPTTFANNDDWHDDVCDGPVRATVRIGGTEIEAEPGYIAVAPPNYAPGLFGVVTMEDTVREAWYDAGWIDRPTTTSFTEHLWPIFDRMSQMAWINHGLFVALGTGSPLDARAPAVIARLRDPGDAATAWRQRVFDLFLAPDASEFQPDRLPQVFGDGYFETRETHAIERLAVTRTLYEHLQRWRQGDFIDDWPGAPPEPPAFEDLEPAAQVRQLESAALYEALGGPFHPGIELTWNLRDIRQWRAPYRLAVLDGDEAARQDFGDRLTRAECLDDHGPLHGVAPGALTRWLGVPWQTDEASCNSDADYAPSLYLSMPSFWGARVPEQVLSTEGWSRVVDASAAEAQRWKHFHYREDWLRDIRGRNYLERITSMVSRWWQLGIVTPRHAVDVPEAMPAFAHVETGRPSTVAGTNAKLSLTATIERLDAPQDGPGAGLESDASAERAAPHPAKTYRPPRKRYRRGEV